MQTYSRFLNLQYGISLIHPKIYPDLFSYWNK